MLDTILDLLTTAWPVLVSVVLGYLAISVRRQITAKRIADAKAKAERAVASKRSSEMENAIQAGLVGLLRERIVDVHKRVTNDGTITYNELVSFNGLHTVYTTLGGNGVVSTLVNDIESIRVV